MLLWKLLLCFLLPVQLLAQSVHVHGRITNQATGEGLMGAYILTVNKGKYTGTVTNQEGYFAIHILPGTDSLQISHMGFQMVKIAAKDSIHIALQEATIALEEVEVVQESAHTIIKKAIAALPQNYSQKPDQAKGFYREIIREEKEYLSVAEAVFDLLSFPNQKENLQLRLIQGRASEAVKATRLFEDFHPGGGPQLLAGLDIRLNPPTFLQKKYIGKYEFLVDSITYLGDLKIYIIHFDQKKEVKEALLTGKVMIEAKHYAVTGYEAANSNRGLPYLKHLTGEDKMIAALLNIDFKQLHRNMAVNYYLRDGKWQMTSASFNTGIYYKQPKKDLDLKIVIASELVITERNAYGGKPLNKAEKWEPKHLVINLSTDYNEAYWGENNILSPTKKLREIIAGLQAREVDTQPFNNTTWQVFKPNLVKVFQENESIYMSPLMKCEWQQDNNGPLLYQSVHGDFSIESTIHIAKTTDSLLAPDRGFQAGGLLIRDTLSAKENYLFLGIGTGGSSQLKVLIHNTIEGNSAVHPVKIESATYHLKIDKKGNTFTLYARKENEAEFQILKTIERKGFPEDVQAGMAVYSHFPGNGPKMRPDLIVRFSRTKITTP